MNQQIDPVAALRTLPAFANASLRLLDDLAERLLLLGADGSDGGEMGGILSVLRGGSPSLGPDGALLSGRERALVEEVLDASPALAHSVLQGGVEGLVGAARRRGRKKGRDGHSPRGRWLVEASWVCAGDDFTGPLVALTHLLAAAIQALFDEPAIVVTLGARPRVDLWDHGRMIDVTAAMPVAPLDTLKHRAIVKAACGGVGRRLFHRIFFVDPAGGHVPPAGLARQRLHRIVYVTRKLPGAMPAALRACLEPALFGVGASGPGFGAFVPSVILPVARPAPTSWWSAAQRGGDVVGFRAAPIREDVGPSDAGAGRAGPGRLIERDLCRMQLDDEAIGRLWNAWGANRLPDASFAAAVRRVHPTFAAPLDRWARAVTNRQVGIGLSGGGACAYRAVPLLSILVRRLGVPIDVIGGVSGGSVIAAYFATYGLEGLRLAVERGPTFSTVVAASMFDSRAIAVQVDADLGGTRIEELETRFVPVTTKLPMDERPPHGAVVVRGTCGAGVRVSGSAPGGFAPTQIGGSRYTDGFASTMIPGRVLRSYGADVVLACNCIPGPGEGQPLEQSRLGRVLYHGVPFFGRMVDAWVSIAYLFQETSRRAGVDADRFVEFPAEDVPLVEMTQWSSALAITHRARSQHGARLWTDARAFRTLWRQVGRRPPSEDVGSHAA